MSVQFPVASSDFQGDVQEQNLYERACRILERMKNSPARDEETAREERELVASLLEEDIRKRLDALRESDKPVMQQFDALRTSVSLLREVGTQEANHAFVRLLVDSDLKIWGDQLGLFATLKERRDLIMAYVQQLRNGGISCNLELYKFYTLDVPDESARKEFYALLSQEQREELEGWLRQHQLVLPAVTLPENRQTICSLS